LGHGSQNQEGQVELLALAEGLRRQTAGPVTAGVLEYPAAELPDIQAAFADAAEAGATELVALPALLHFAGHAKEDMPAQVAIARALHPDIHIILAGPLGYDDRLLRVVEERLAPFAAGEDTAVLLVGRGSTDPEANADLFKLARLLWDRNRFGWVEASFVSLAPPGVAAGIERCLKLGAQRVVVMPYFLCTGVLVKRIAEQALQIEGNIEVASHLGVHELVIEVLLDRLGQARAGVCPCLAAAGCRLPNATCGRGALCLAS
jgi:sirohydrochlorin cobaltochelatase